MINSNLTCAQFAAYYARQSEMLSAALEALDVTWEHSEIVRALLENVRAELERLKAGYNLEVCDQKDSMFHERKVEKYTTWIEVLRLIQFQYSRYSNLHRSEAEGLYSTLLALAIKHGRYAYHKIGVLGCGPGRSVLDFAEAFPDAQVVGLDYSLLSLVVANIILGDTNQGLQIPYRDVYAPQSVSSLLSIPSFSLPNYSLSLCDLSVPQTLRADLIICSNTVNLLPDHDAAVQNITQMLSPGGLIIFADLLGWRLDRKPEQRILRNESSIRECFARHGISELETFVGGPYLERETADQYTTYMEHFFVGMKGTEL